MHIYIPEFWCGVGATIVAEILAIVVGAIYYNMKARGGKRR